MFEKTSFFLVVSTSAYLVIKTSRGFNKDTAMAVDAIVLNIIQKWDGPAKYLIISKLWNWIAVYNVLEKK